MNSEEKEILFERYEQGLMSAEERADFESMLDRDPELRSDFDAHRVAALLGEQLSRKALHQKFEDWDAEISTARKKRITALITGAALLLLVCAGAYWWYKNRSAPGAPEGKERFDGVDTLPKPDSLPPAPDTNKQKVAGSETKPGRIAPSGNSGRLLAVNYMDARSKSMYANASGVRGTQPTIDPALELLHQEKYADALAAAEKSADPNNRLLFRGMALFYLQRYDEAAAAFTEWGKASEETTLTDWYLSLCCAAASNPSPACLQKLKQQAADPNFPYRTEAEALWRQ